jgi:uncharacterized membrane protein HdeD (DUF308 family)
LVLIIWNLLLLKNILTILLKYFGVYDFTSTLFFILYLVTEWLITSYTLRIIIIFEIRFANSTIFFRIQIISAIVTWISIIATNAIFHTLFTLSRITFIIPQITFIAIISKTTFFTITLRRIISIFWTFYAS